MVVTGVDPMSNDLSIIIKAGWYMMNNVSPLIPKATGLTRKDVSVWHSQSIHTEHIMLI